MSFKRLEESLDIIQSITGSADNNYGLTEKEMKAKFDEAANKIKTFINDHLGDLETRTAADNIGYDGELGGESHTVGEALDAITAAGTGTIPPDNTIGTGKIMDNAITEVKLALELAQKINAVKVKIGTLSPTYAQGAEGVETIVPSGTEGTVQLHAYQTFDLGFTPQAVLLLVHEFYDHGADWDEDKTWYLGFGKKSTYKDSADSEREWCDGGFAIGGVGATCIDPDCGEIFSIVENGIKTRRYSYDNEKSSGRKRIEVGELRNAAKLYYIAVG